MPATTVLAEINRNGKLLAREISARYRAKCAVGCPEGGVFDFGAVGHATVLFGSSRLGLYPHLDARLSTDGP